MPESPAIGLADASTTSVLDAARGGDNAAWEELVRRYGSLLRGTIAPYRLTPTNAADAMQTTWLRLLERVRARSVIRKGSARGWPQPHDANAWP